MSILDKFDTKTNANKGVRIPLLLIDTGVESGAFITVLGGDSDVFHEIQLERARDNLDRRVPMTPEEVDEQGLLTLARCTVSWELDGAPPFTQKAAVELYRQYPAIREQVNVAIARRANFLKG